MAGSRGEKRQSYLLIFLICATLFTTGILDGYRSVILPIIKTAFEASYDSQGLFNSLYSVGHILACFTTSVTLRKLGVRGTLITAYCVLMLSFVGMQFVSSFAMATAAFVLLRFGLSCEEGGVNGMSNTFGLRTAKILSFGHFFYGVGSIIGPKIAGAVLGTGADWRRLYLFTIVLPLCFTVLALFIKIAPAPAAGREQENTGRAFRASDALKRKEVWLFALCIAVIGQVETATTIWGGLYLQDNFGIDPLTVGATFMSVHFLLLTLGRLICSVLIEKVGPVKMEYFLLLGCVLTFGVGFLLGANGLYALSAVGLFTSGIWPTVVAMSSMVYKKSGYAPICMSVAGGISGILTAIFAFLVGLVNQYIGPAWGFRTTVLMSVVAIALFTYTVRDVRRRGLYPAANA